MCCSSQAHPSNVATSFKQRAMLLDEIWHAAGDDGSDIDWYVKRTVLGGIYSTTEIYMLTDSSPGLFLNFCLSLALSETKHFSPVNWHLEGVSNMILITPVIVFPVCPTVELHLDFPPSNWRTIVTRVEREDCYIPLSCWFHSKVLLHNPCSISNYLVGVILICVDNFE